MIRIVTGPPCAGKSTYVAEHKDDGDVVDFDLIARAMGAPGHLPDSPVSRPRPWPPGTPPSTTS